MREPFESVEALESRQMLSASPVNSGHLSHANAKPEPILAAVATPFSGPVAHLSGLRGIASDFRNLNAMINWGDGTSPTPATFTRGSGGVAVIGTHTFAQTGTFAVAVTVSKGQLLPHKQAPSSFPDTIAQVQGTADVPPEQTSGGVTIQEIARQTFTATVGTFQFSLTGLAIHASIDWGDGSVTTGVVQGTNGNYQVSGTHTYSSAGTYTIGISVGASPVGKPGQPIPQFFILIADIHSTAIVTAPNHVAPLLQKGPHSRRPS